MRGKIVNLCIGFANILFGVLILVYTLYIPQDVVALTVQELGVVNKVLIGIYVILTIIVIINIYKYRNAEDNSAIKTGYLLGIFALSFIFIKQPIISAFTILSGIITIVQTLKDKAVDVDSTTKISIVSVFILSIVIFIGIAVSYRNIGQYIKNKENENNQKYRSDYFKYVTELDISDYYINVKKDNKYGYINQKGEVVIDFMYDYASPFVNISAYDKNFQVALVCKDGISKIILKNQREVMTYSSESSEENYEAKMQELEDIYKNTLKQQSKMQLEIQPLENNNITKVERYVDDTKSNEYTYKYAYNDQFDIVVTKSNLGQLDKYELVKKDNNSVRIVLDCENIDYDENNLYLYSNYSIPFFNISSKEQGWFTSYGKKNAMTGKAQILDFIDNDKLLIRNYNDNSVYFINLNGDKVSDVYKDIYILEDRYIVKNSSNKYMVIDKNFSKVFDAEFDAIDTSLIKYGLYIVTDLSEVIDFNQYNFAKMNWRVLNSNGDTIGEGIEQIYTNYYKISNDKDVAYVTRYEEFLNVLKDVEYDFVGDKFYKIEEE